MAKMTTGMRMLAMTKAQQRDSRGRYMEGGDGAQARYYPGGTPPYVNGNEMRGPRMYEENPLNGVDTQHQPYTHSNPRSMPPEEPGKATGPSSRMSREGYVTWNRMGMDEPQNLRPYPPIYPRSTMADGNITSMHDYEMKKSAPDHRRMIGYHQDDEDEPEHLDREKAEKWVKRMKNIQIKMPYEEVQRRAVNYGIEHEKIPEFYAAFNMIQSDYGMVAKEFGVSNPDFYAAMAKAWIMDDDAVEGKTALYEKCIVKSH